PGGIATAPSSGTRTDRRGVQRRVDALTLLLCAAFAAPTQAVVLTGEARAVGAQAVITPQSSFSPVVIRYFVPEGESVKQGDVVLRIDPGQSAAKIPDLEAQIDQARARGDKEIAELEVKAV